MGHPLSAVLQMSMNTRTGYSNVRFRYRRERDWIVSIVTLTFAGLWYQASVEVTDYVQRINLERAVAGAMSVGASSDQPVRRNPLIDFFTPGSSRPSPEEAARAKKLKEQIGWAEGVSTVWRRVMVGIALFLISVGVLSVFRRLVRILQLLAGAVIIAGAVASLVALALLVDPAGGGLPPLSRWTPVLVVLVQGFYGGVLCIAFARRAKAIAFDAAGSFISPSTSD